MCYAVFMNGADIRKPTYEELLEENNRLRKENLELRSMVENLLKRVEELEK